MDSLNDLLYQKGGQNVKEGGNAGDSRNENEMQALYFDLLACLAGEDHPSLPQGYKQKPMTGFSAILDAFNESNKVRESGSSLIQEVNSKEFIDQSSTDMTESMSSAQNEDLSFTSSGSIRSLVFSPCSKQDENKSVESSSQREPSAPESELEIFSSCHDIPSSLFYDVSSDFDTSREMTPTNEQLETSVSQSAWPRVTGTD